MRVLFLTISSIESVSSRGIYTDLMREFRNRGDALSVVCPVERRSGKATEMVVEEGIEILRVRIGNVTKTSLLEKGLSTLLIEFKFIAAIEAYLQKSRFDLVLYSTPPVTFERVVRHVKKRDKCMSYLLLKDIFPQNAVDLDMIHPGGLIWHYFRWKERRLYALSDWIGCMSHANKEYLLMHNPEILQEKVEICPNSIFPLPLDSRNKRSLETRKEWTIPENALVFVLGGNLGRPQGLSFLIEIIDRMKARRDVFFLIVGAGTEFARIDGHIRDNGIRNVKLLSTLSKERYDALLRECDIGLIFLDPRFTIPNFPSRLTAYMESAKPIIAATDIVTDIKDVLLESNSGFWVRNGDLEGFEEAVNRLAADPSLRRQMGLNGRAYLEEHYTVSKAYGIITAHFADKSGV